MSLRDVALVFSVALICLSGCQKEQEPVVVATPPPATPTPVPEITPNPARGAIQAAVAFYPDLAKKDSTFNLMFRDLYEDRKKTRPASLAAPDWPLTLAQEVAGKLGVQPVTPGASPSPSPTASPVASPSAPRNWENPLEQGPYNGDDHAMHGEAKFYTPYP